MKPAAYADKVQERYADGFRERRAAEEDRSVVDEVAERLLRELRDSPTDLAKLVGATLRRRATVVAIPSAAIARWEKDDPRSWRLVEEWLVTRGVRIILS
jgi:hypothetical protein